MAEAIKTSLPFVVDELFSVSTIDVVRSVSADKLKSALQWLVEGVQKLQGEQTVLRQDLAELSPQLSALSQGPAAGTASPLPAGAQKVRIVASLCLPFYLCTACTSEA